MATLFDTGANLFTGFLQNRRAKDQRNIQREEQALEAAKFNRAAPGERANTALRGDYLANYQTPTFSGTGLDYRMTGGYGSPNLITPDTRALGANMSRQAYLSQMGQAGPNDPYQFNSAWAPKQQPTALSPEALAVLRKMK